ncbi:serine hydrolase domain-containing protein [Phenylobacterium sp.]|uniref:serine hydrolase domain-containing protein n=1 Tax=Phenylobacterium sp. TaxID=1871053 RepID=UPI0037C79154
MTFLHRLAPMLAGAFLLGGTPVLAQLAPPPQAPQTALATPPDGALEAFVDGWMRDAMSRDKVAGAAVSIVQGGRVVVNKGYGFASLTPRRAVDPDRTLFRIGSVSKTFTWILVMREIEAGRMRLDAPINRYLPERVRLPGDGGAIRVRDLMDHTPGFEDRALGQLFEREARRVRPLDLYLRQERPDIVRPPGRVSSYSNYGVALAGSALARLGGRTFERRVEDEILAPLGMSHTTFREPRPERLGLPAPMPARLRPHVAEGFAWRAGGFVATDYEFIGQIGPAGSASSTAGDMARYMLMLLGDGTSSGVTIYGPRAARAFEHPLRQTPPGINGWAHGFMVYPLPGGLNGYGHGGATIAFHTALVVVPALDLGVFVTTNSPAGMSLAAALPEAVVRQVTGKAEGFPRPSSQQLTAIKSDFTGGYIATRRARGGLEGFVGLFASANDVAVTPDGRLLLGEGGAIRAFVPEGDPATGRFLSVIGDRRIDFQMENGRAVAFRDSTNLMTFRRAGVVERLDILATIAAMTGLASLATLAGLALRNRRELRQNPIQARASLVQTLQAGLWLAALVSFALFGANAADVATVMYGWPDPLLVTASACALVASAMNILAIAALPAVWSGGRRVDSWPIRRKLAFTVTAVIYVGFTVFLGLAGALEPWSR